MCSLGTEGMEGKGSVQKDDTFYGRHKESFVSYVLKIFQKTNISCGRVRIWG